LTLLSRCGLSTILGFSGSGCVTYITFTV